MLWKFVYCLLIWFVQGEIWVPPPRTTWQWQLTQPVKTSFDVQVYDIDLEDTPQQKIDYLHSKGRKVICYFSAGSYEEWRPDAHLFPPEVLGNNLAGWPGERWLDVRRIDVLGPIMEARLDNAQMKQCDGVEPDNVDGYQNNNGFGLTGEDQLMFNRWLANAAHNRGLSIGLKNDLDQIEDLVNDFDFAVNEQCFQYNECDRLKPFVVANKAVFGVEYKGKLSSFCRKAKRMQFSWLKKRLSLTPWVRFCPT